MKKTLEQITAEANKIIPLNRIQNVSRVSLHEYTFIVIGIAGTFTASRKLDGWGVNLDVSFTDGQTSVRWHYTDAKEAERYLWTTIEQTWLVDQESRRENLHKTLMAGILGK